MSQRASNACARHTRWWRLAFVLSAACSRTELSTAPHLIQPQGEAPVPTLSTPSTPVALPTAMMTALPTAAPPTAVTVPTLTPTASPPTAPTTTPGTVPVPVTCVDILFEACASGSFCDEGTLVSCSTDSLGCPTQSYTPDAAECTGIVDDCTDGRDECNPVFACDGGTCPSTDCIAVDYEIPYQVGWAVHSGSTVGATSNIISDCALGARSPDVVYHWAAPGDGCYQVDTFGANYDSAIALRSLCPDFEELLCNDDAGPGSGVAFEANEGEEFFFVVDGYASGSAGEYVLSVRECGEVCDDLGVDEDDDGATDCDDPECQGSPPCIDELCDNRVDDDGDELTDCSDADCFGHSTCFEYCDDGLDNDSDGAVDCLDSTCLADPACTCSEGCCVDGELQPIAGCETCSCAATTCDPDAGLCICPQVDVEAPSIIDAVLVNGTTIGASDDVDSSCVDDDGDDIVVSWIAPVSGCIRFSTQGSDFDSLLYIQTCDGAPNELACDDDLAGLSNAEIDLSVTEGTQYYIVVDGYDPSQWGDYVLNAWTCP